MANTYTQIHIQCVFAVRNRRCVIQRAWKDELYKYITGIIQHYGHKVLAINGMPDHIHIFFGMRPTQSLSDLMQDVKGSSSKWINDKRLVPGKFVWQEGYGGFSYSREAVQNVVNYIINQETHHRKTNFIDEYKKILQEFEVEFDPQYLFEPIL